MKKIELKQGGHPLRNDDFNFMQSGYFEALKAIIAIFDPSLNCIMSGVVITETSTDITFTSGYVAWQGEIFTVDGGTFSKVVGGNLYFKLEENVMYPSPVTYKDQTIQNVHIDRKLVLKYFTVGDTGEYMSAFSRISSLGFKRGMEVTYHGNVNSNFDSTGLGINDMAGFGIMNGNTYTISGGIPFTVPDKRGRTTYGASNVPSTGAPAYNTALGTFNYGSFDGSNNPKILRTHLPNYNLPGSINFTVDFQLYSYEHRLQSGNPVRGLFLTPHDLNPQLHTITSQPVTGGISIELGGDEANFSTTGAYHVGVPVIKL